MKKSYKKLIVCALLPLTACNGWLREDGPMTNRVGDFFTSAQTAVQVVNAAYTPLMWEYQGTYYSEFFIGDILSDDALKGGQNTSDMPAAYDLENFKTISNNELVLQYYRAQYQGIARCNLALEQIPLMEDKDGTFTTELRSRLLGEAHFLRAYYYFRLVRLFGDVPIVKTPVYSSEEWRQPRSSVPDVYALIFEDLTTAEPLLINKSEYESTELGRVTKGAAQAMLLKANLYFGDYCRRTGTGDASAYYKEAAKWGATFVLQQAGEYDLCPKYADNFTLAGENGMESVFEVQYMSEGTSDYGEGNGFSRGTFTTILTRSRSQWFKAVGWGFNHPTQNLYDEYESGDPRRDASILALSDEQITNPSEDYYLGNRYYCAKRTILDDTRNYVTLEDSHDSRSPINRIDIRLADVYLMYAEAALNTSDRATAKTYLEKVRSRARGTESILPAFPGYKVPDYSKNYALHQLSDTDADLQLAIRHERRVELAMESHRWYDLCRWGIAKEVMDAYKETETTEAKGHMSEFVAGKHELLPIPVEEVRLGGLTQNFGY